MTHNLLNDREVGIAVKRPFSGEQLVQHNTHRKQVDPGVNRLALKLFWRHVFECANHRALGPGGLAGILDAGHAEVGQFDPAIGFNQ